MLGIPLVHVSVQTSISPFIEAREGEVHFSPEKATVLVVDKVHHIGTPFITWCPTLFLLPFSQQENN